MVSAPFHARMNGITFFDRIQVRIFSVLGDGRLTRGSYSRKVGSQQFPLRPWGWVSARRAQRLSERNTRDCSERYRTLGERLRPDPCLLVERAGRNGEEHHREDDCGEVVCRRPARGLLLLFAGLRGPEKPSDDIPYTGRPTRTQVHRISIDSGLVDTVRSGHRLRIAARPDEEVDRRASQ